MWRVHNCSVVPNVLLFIIDITSLGVVHNTSVVPNVLTT